MTRAIALLMVVSVLGNTACSSGGASPAAAQSPAPAPPTAASPPPVAIQEYQGLPLYGNSIGGSFGSWQQLRDIAYVESVSADGTPADNPPNLESSGEIVHVRATRPGYVSVDLQHSAIGPIGALDADTGTLVVLGQRVYITDQTWTTDPGGYLPDIHALAVGDFVSVSGSFTATGDIYATNLTRIPPSGLLLRGILTEADGGGLRIGALGIDLSSALLQGFPGSAPVAGDAVLVRATKLGGDGRLVVDSMQLTSSRWVVGVGNYLAGFVTASRSPTDFDVGGQRVDFQSCECTPLPTAPAIGSPIEVAMVPGGEPSGVMLNLPTWRNAIVTAPIQSIDAAQGSLTVLGISTQVLPAAYIVTDPVPAWQIPSPEENLVMPLLPPGLLADFKVGDNVTIIGGERNGRFIAGAVFRAASVPAGRAYVATSLRTISAYSIRFFGQPIVVDATTLVSDCSLGTCQRIDGPSFFDKATAQYFPPILGIQLNGAGNPLHADSIEVRWQD